MMKLRIESYLFFSVGYYAFRTVPEHTVLHQHAPIIAIVDNEHYR